MKHNEAHRLDKGEAYVRRPSSVRKSEQAATQKLEFAARLRKGDIQITWQTQIASIKATPLRVGGSIRFHWLRAENGKAYVEICQTCGEKAPRAPCAPLPAAAVALLVHLVLVVVSNFPCPAAVAGEMDLDASGGRVRMKREE